MFVKRVISGIVMIAILAACLIPGGYWLAGLLLFCSLTAYRELMKACHLTKEEKQNPAKFFTDLEILGYIGIIAYYAIMVFVKEQGWLLTALFVILILYMFLYVLTYPKYTASDIMRSFFCLAYGPLLITFIWMVRDLENGLLFSGMIFICSSVADICAYCVGMLIGKHKMAPKLSPKKSIEGAIGGVAGSAIVSAVYAHFLIAPVMAKPGVVWISMIIGAIGALVSMVGDLAASGIKRNENIKDYGKLIPGHGGVMDRFDSIIFAAPMIYFLVQLF